MGSPLDEYRRLEGQLRALRGTTSPGGPQEDPLLEAMETLWWVLAEEERTMLDAEGPQCWPDIEAPPDAPRDTNVWIPSLREPPRRAA